MKKKGFTLIELLAVIVVLAIIALIATPIVMNVIKNAGMGAAERSADNYVKAVDLLISTNKLDGNKVEDGEYAIQADGNLTFGTVEVSGTKPNGGTIVVENGQVVKNASSIKVGDYTVTYKDGVAEAKENIASNSELEELCDLVDGKANEVGSKYTCNLGDKDRTFYVLEAGTSSKPVTLILEGNYDTETLAFSDNYLEDAYLTSKFDEISAAWIKLDRSQIGIPSIEQILVADGLSLDILNSNSYVYYEGLSNEWLYGENDYWTSTIRLGFGGEMWVVTSDGSVTHDGYDIENCYVVRPVIMLSI